ncbi:O-antigen ligase [Mycobacterium sp. SMC-4]|uniref:O-antigen ligase family protein n=1 Tax=Mycobacterium sp. SMC-4 TaxID=2857059 RepID=UPI002202CB59|nr:O-antigen ligase family protein [Mycobacterium sp. SMC-4]UXA19564.1 O-antigen ligase family protein [Mycobacterium sp. SMC-4]
MTIAAATLVTNVVVPHRIRLIGVVVLLVPQLYLPGIHAELATAAVLWTLSTCVMGSAARGRPAAQSPLIAIMCMFVAITVVSLLWATPDGVNSGAATAVRSTVFLLWLREVIVVAKDNPRLLDTLVMWTVPGVAAQSVLAIVFRSNPHTEQRFLNSELAPLLVGPQSVDLYTTLSNNVWYADKAGGVFVNGNIASLLGGIAALLYIITARRTGSRWLYWAAALAFTGTVFTGSKTAIFVATGCAIMILLLPHMLHGFAVLAAIPVVLLLPLVTPMMMEILQKASPEFFARSEYSLLEGRRPIWEGASALFQDHFFLGLGFGGWAEEIVAFTSRRTPPHNFIIAAWANSGILAALVVVAFVAATILLGLRVAASQPTVRDRRTAVLALCVVAWVFLHGMADNTTLYGEQRTMILFALAIGYLYVMDLEVGDDDTQTVAAVTTGPGVVPIQRRATTTPTAAGGRAVTARAASPGRGTRAASTTVSKPPVR